MIKNAARPLASCIRIFASCVLCVGVGYCLAGCGDKPQDNSPSVAAPAGGQNANVGVSANGGAAYGPDGKPLASSPAPGNPNGGAAFGPDGKPLSAGTAPGPDPNGGAAFGPDGKPLSGGAGGKAP